MESGQRDIIGRSMKLGHGEVKRIYGMIIEHTRSKCNNGYFNGDIYSLTRPYRLRNTLSPREL